MFKKRGQEIKHGMKHAFYFQLHLQLHNLCWHMHINRQNSGNYGPPWAPLSNVPHWHAQPWFLTSLTRCKLELLPALTCLTFWFFPEFPESIIFEWRFGLYTYAFSFKLPMCSEKLGSHVRPIKNWFLFKPYDSSEFFKLYYAKFKLKTQPPCMKIYKAKLTFSLQM